MSRTRAPCRPPEVALRSFGSSRAARRAGARGGPVTDFAAGMAKATGTREGKVRESAGGGCALRREVCGPQGAS